MTESPNPRTRQELEAEYNDLMAQMTRCDLSPTITNHPHIASRRWERLYKSLNDVMEELNNLNDGADADFTDEEWNQS